MKWIVFVGLMILCIMMVLCYALLVAASNADDEAEKLWKEWKERDDDDTKRVRL